MRDRHSRCRRPAKKSLPGVRPQHNIPAEPLLYLLLLRIKSIYKYPMGVYNEKEVKQMEKKKERTEKEFKDLIHRLNRIEGQIRGIRGMVEDGRYCTDILVQVAAVNAALNSFNKKLLENHLKTCVVRDIREGKDDTVDELMETLGKLMK